MNTIFEEDTKQQFTKEINDEPREGTKTETENNEKIDEEEFFLKDHDRQVIEEKSKEIFLHSHCVTILQDELYPMYEAQEPWPSDVKLYQPYEVEQILLPDNANCLAVKTFLKMCNLDFKTVFRPNAEDMSPSGKVPFIKCGAFLISELEPIVLFVEKKGITLTSELDKDQKDDMRAYMSLIHNVFETAELYICWCHKETYNEVTVPRYGSIYPFPLNYFKIWSKKSSEVSKLKMLEWYNKSLQDVYREVENCCQAITDRLDAHEYFFGNKPTELDALLFGHIFTILTTPLPNSELASIVRNYPSLIHMAEKIEKKYFKA